MTRHAIVPTHRHDLYDQPGYSPAVRAGDLVFVSGQVGARPDGTPEPDLDKQVQLAFDNLSAILSAAGGSFDDVVDVMVFVVDPESNLETISGVLRENFGAAPYPTLTGVGATWLSGFLFEIKVVAHIPVGSTA